METIIELILMGFIVTFMIDGTDAIDSMVKPMVRRIFRLPANANISLKPFDCSLCMTFWIGLVYIIFADFTLVNLLAVCAVAYFTPVMKDIWFLVRDVFTYLINCVWKMFD